MKKGEQKNKNLHIGRGLLALLLCLCIIIPVASGVLLAVSALDFSSLIKPVPVAPEDEWSKENRPDAEELLGEGSKYLDEFLEEHPDASMDGGFNGVRPLSVGNEDTVVAKEWFNVKVKVMADRYIKGTYSLGNEKQSTSKDTLWNSITNGELKAFEMTLRYPDDLTAWKGPKSGLMKWNAQNFVTASSGYPQLRSPFSNNQMDYGIFAAYVDNTRIYNVGNIKAGGKMYLWVSLSEEDRGDGEGVVILADTEPNERVTLHYGPIEYPVNYEVTVNGKSIYAMQPAELQAAFGNGVTTADAALIYVFGDMQTLTSGQTVENNIRIPSSTIANVYYVNDGVKGNPYYPLNGWNEGQDKDGNDITGANYPLGTDVAYALRSESTDDGDVYWTEIDVTGGPSRYSHYESYSMGSAGVADGEVTVRVEIKDAPLPKYDHSFVGKNGYSQSNYNDHENTLYNIVNGCEPPQTGTGTGNMKDNGDGTYTWTWTFEDWKEDGSKTSNKSGKPSPNVAMSALASLAINEEDIELPDADELNIRIPTDSDIPHDFWEGDKGSPEEYNDYDSATAETFLYDEGKSGDDWYAKVTVTLEYRQYCYVQQWTSGANNSTRIWHYRCYTKRWYDYTVTVLLKERRNVTVTEYVEVESDKSLFGWLHLRSAEGVRVQFRWARYRANTSANRKWKEMSVKRRMIFGLRTELLTGFHFSDDKRGGSYCYLSSEGFNVRFTPKDGYVLEGMNKNRSNLTAKRMEMSGVTYTRYRDETFHPEVTRVDELDDQGVRWYGITLVKDKLGNNYKPSKPTRAQKKADPDLRYWKNAYVDISAILLHYEVHYRDGMGSTDSINQYGSDGRAEMDNPFRDFSLNVATMPGTANKYGNYRAEVAYSYKSGENMVRIAGGMPKDGNSLHPAPFKYWVLTDASGNPVDMDGNPLSLNDPSKWITFEPSENISVSEFDAYAKSNAGGAYYSDNEIYSKDSDAGSATFNYRYVIYLTAYWNLPQDAYTQFVSANTRADKDGNEQNWFAGEVYETKFGTLLEGVQDARPGNADKYVRAIAREQSAIYKNAMFKDGQIPGSIDKDKMIAFMRDWDMTHPGNHYNWFTLDDKKNGDYMWPNIQDMGVMDLWFLDTAGSLTFVNSIDGYDHPDGVPYKITLIPKVYNATSKDSDDFGRPTEAMPYDENGDGAADWYDFLDYRYTAINEHKFFDGEIGITTTGKLGDAFKGTAAGTVKLKRVKLKDSFCTYNGVKHEYEEYEYYAIVYLRDGESITFDELPEGTEYRVELYNEDAHLDYPDNDKRHKYDGYYMTGFEKVVDGNPDSATASRTEWRSNEDNHSTSYAQFALATEKAKDKDGKVLKAGGGVEYFAYGSSAKSTETGKSGVVAYDTQVIKITTKGTYSLYLDQYTSVQTADQDIDDNWTPGEELQVQNFNYLSYLATAKNLTNEPQDLKITLAVDTSGADGKPVKDRYLAIALIGNAKIPWNPEDGELHPDQLSGTARFTCSDGEREGKWEYDLDSHSIIVTVENVPAGESITLRARNTVPAVNTETTYATVANLDAKVTDADGEDQPFGLESNDVKAEVYSNWLRIMVYIGNDSYMLTKKDEAETFEFEIKLTHLPERTGGDDSKRVVKFMLYEDSDTYGLEDGTLVVQELNSFREADGTISGTFKLQKSADTDTSLAHEWRIVIFELTTEEKLDEDDQYDGETGAKAEPLEGVGYEVKWVPKPTENGGTQDDDYAAYVTGSNGKDNLKKVPSTTQEQDTYTGRIGDLIDMVVYHFMPSKSLTIKKTVEGKGKDLEWLFDLVLENGELELNKDDFTFKDDIKPSDFQWGTKTIKVPKLDENGEPMKDEDGNPIEVDKTLLTAKFTLKDGESFTIVGLPQGTDYTITESCATDVNFTGRYRITDGYLKDGSVVHPPVGEKATKGKTAVGSIYVNKKELVNGEWKLLEDDEGNPIPADNMVEFTNSLTGDLKINKVLPERKENESTFKFEIELEFPADCDLPVLPGMVQKEVDGVPVPNVYIYTVTVTVEDVTDEESEFFGLGTWVGSALVEDLPNNTKYTVTEIDEKNNYKKTWEGNTGNINAEVTEATCTNVKTATLIVEKEVTGNSGSQIEEFEFTITLNDLEETYTVTSSAGNTWVFRDGANKVKLKHGESITITGLPVGTTYTVTEVADSSYTTSIKVDGKDVSSASGMVALGVDGGTKVTYTNDRNGNTPGGINLPFLWAIPLLLVAIGGVAAIVIKKRRSAAI